jgi:hypothetical protein
MSAVAVATAAASVGCRSPEMAEVVAPVVEASTVPSASVESIPVRPGTPVVTAVTVAMAETEAQAASP